ncbi:hypothetical protein T11_6724 [Trichinella zimbabwensis]|uniref:Uncharacterized protein n=1 Tax=Trichinella zimbabwensis TaxID=268475 RepID=A0A0V1HX60_9BILA|nr:hypothetical protein T11_6724 [Trichinella zimbabwensis]
MRTWGMDGTFKVVPQWYQQLFTIHAFVAGKLVPAVYCLCTGKDIGTYGAATSTSARRYIDRKVGELGLKTRYRQHEETKRKIRMLLATAFLPVPQVDTGVSLLEAGTTASLSCNFRSERVAWSSKRKQRSRKRNRSGRHRLGKNFNTRTISVIEIAQIEPIASKDTRKQK